ncbi:hypothetical protein Cantr_01281 [Candida viswanathii]|uniref:Uncharacterized protein n=1 Tax=Candida viswanathii TaxID=5486 RepID=A0A367YII0_9ASCO|nr:hypothetical protein Cantr_01281 [Candida viswanathii]
MSSPKSTRPTTHPTTSPLTSHPNQKFFRVRGCADPTDAEDEDGADDDTPTIEDTFIGSQPKGSVKAVRGIIKDQATVDKIKLENQEALRKDMDAKMKLEKQKKLNDELTKDLFKKSDTSSNPFGGGSNPFSNPFGLNPLRRNRKRRKQTG